MSDKSKKRKADEGTVVVAAPKTPEKQAARGALAIMSPNGMSAEKTKSIAAVQTLDGNIYLIPKQYDHDMINLFFKKKDPSRLFVGHLVPHPLIRSWTGSKAAWRYLGHLKFADLVNQLGAIRLFASYIIKEVAGIHEVHVHGEDSMRSYLAEKAEKLSFATVHAMAAEIDLKPIFGNEDVQPVLDHLFGSITKDVDEAFHSLRGNGGDRGAGAGAGGASAGGGGSGSGSGSGASGSGSGLTHGLDFTDV